MPSNPLRPALLALIIGVSACSADAGRPPSTERDTSVADGSVDGDRSDAVSVFVDAGRMPDGGVATCNQVDLLVVLDNSLSMGVHQEALAAAFPGFVDAMYEQLPVGTDLHVGITTTAFFEASCAESVANCVSTSTPEEIRDHYVPPTEGRLADNGTQGRLFEHAGVSWYEADTSAARDGLKDWFSQAAVAAGEAGCSFEMPTAAAAYALHDANSADNAGFLRDDDAVLIIFFLTDEPDKSPEELAAYVAMVNAAKSACGGERCVIPAGIIDPCVEGVDNVLWRFLHSFGREPLIGDIDAHDLYQQVIGDALAEVVRQACDEVTLI